ncbi:MAG: class I SAM-dependent methyltransferase [Burkholderiaceae bacterium]
MSNTHFGFKSVEESQKASRVRGVFDSVASRYDVMNDLMSMGLHRVWKAYTIAVANARLGDRVLDIAGGTGDLALAFSKQGRTRRHRRSHRHQRSDAAAGARPPAPMPACCCRRRSAMPRRCRFRRPRSISCRVAFGLRNMTHKDRALTEMNRVLRPGGRLLVLEFSRVAKPLEKAYDWYSFNVLPKIGQWVAGDADSYRYLAESIRMHPDQDALKAMMKSAGFAHVDVHNLSAGVVALHVGIKC